MKEISTITQETMGSREIANLTEKEHKNVLRDVEKLNMEYESMGMLKCEQAPYIHSQNKQTYLEYRLTRMQTLDLMTGYHTSLRIKVNRRWEELEKEKAAGQIEKSEDEILRNAFLILDNRVKKLESKIEEDRDKVQFFNDVTGSKDAVEMGKAAKILDLGMGRNKLFEYLRENNVLRSNNEPYQKYIDNGWFRIIEQKYNPNPGETRINVKTLVYQKGLNGISKMITSDNRRM
jgi:phage antirepressor YoqD-like protein